MAEFFGNYRKRFGNKNSGAATELGVTIERQLKTVEALNDAASRLGEDAGNLDESVNLFILDKLS